MQVYNWCFTLNNWDEVQREKLIEVDYNYMIIGKEVGENGTPHLQGYIEFRSRKRLKTVKKINNNIHWEPRRGTQRQAIEYCMKDGDYEEFGKKKMQGKRNDLDAVRETAAQEGMREVTCRYNRQQIGVAEKFLTYNESGRKSKPKVIWLHGQSGAGKTRRAVELSKGLDTYWKDNTKWWDGYDRHDCTIIDDYRETWEFSYLLRILDRYPVRIEVKGGYRQFVSDLIIITCPVHPIDLNIGEESLKQLTRRLDEIVLIDPEVD